MDDDNNEVLEVQEEKVVPKVGHICFNRDAYEEAVAQFMRGYYGGDRAQLHAALNSLLFELICKQLG